VKKWFLKYTEYVIVPHNSDGSCLSESQLKLKFPKLYSFLLKFKDKLINRSTYKLMGKNKPFYSIFKIGNYTFSTYRVLFGRKAGQIAAVVSQPITDKFLGKTLPIPDYDVILIGCKSSDEAHYLCSVVNSLIVNYWIATHVSRSFPNISMQLLENIKIPKFDPKNPFHQKLSQLSQKAHEIAKKIYEENREDLKENLKKIEEEIDKTVAKLYDITDDELKEIRKCLMILKEGEIPEEEEESEEEQQIVLPKEDIEINVNPLLIEENKQQELTVSVQNNTDKPIKDVKLEVKLKSKSLLTKTIKEIKPNDLVSLKFTVPKLKSGEYELEIHFSSQNVKFKELRKLFVKEKKKKIKKAKGSLDDELERLLGG